MKITKGVRAYCTNEPGKKKGDEEMLYIGENQSTEEIMVEDNVEIKDTGDREE